MEDFYRWYSQNVKYPKEAKRTGIQGKVEVQLTVEADGSLTNIKIAKGIGGGCDEEVLRVLSKAEKWIPAKAKGNPVKCALKLPFIFRLE